MVKKKRGDGAAKLQSRGRRSPQKAPAEPKESTQASQERQGFLFDPYWDDAFSAYYDPTLRTCCQLKY